MLNSTHYPGLEMVLQHQTGLMHELRAGHSEWGKFGMKGYIAEHDNASED